MTIGVIYGVVYEGYRNPHFLDWDTVPPLFRTQLKKLPSTEAICVRGLNYTKTIFGRAPPRAP